MSKNKNQTVTFGDVELIATQCRACRKFLGYSERRVSMFCDAFCATTREWVWENDRLTDLIVSAHEVDGKSIPEISAALRMDRYKVHAMYKTYLARKLRARM